MCFSIGYLVGTTKYPFLIVRHYFKCVSYCYLLNIKVYLFHVVASYLLVHNLLIMWLHDDLNLFVSSSIITIVKLGSLVQHLMATCTIRLLV
jgi:hypothetical protein